MRLGWIAAAAAMIWAAPAAAARYYEFQVVGLTGVPFFNPNTGETPFRFLIESTVTSRFDSLGIPFSTNPSGFRIVFSTGGPFARITTAGAPGGTTFDVGFDLGSVPLGETLIRIPAFGALGYTTCYTSACVNTAGGFVALFARTFDTAPPSFAAVDSTAIVGIAGIPEPASWAMTILGIAAIGFNMRRRTIVRFA